MNDLIVSYAYRYKAGLFDAGLLSTHSPWVQRTSGDNAYYFNTMTEKCRLFPLRTRIIPAKEGPLFQESQESTGIYHTMFVFVGDRIGLVRFRSLGSDHHIAVLFLFHGWPMPDQRPGTRAAHRSPCATRWRWRTKSIFSNPGPGPVKPTAPPSHHSSSAPSLH